MTRRRCRSRLYKPNPPSLLTDSARLPLPSNSRLTASDDHPINIKGGSRVSLHGNNPEPPMSALGQKQTSGNVGMVSSLIPKGNIAECLMPPLRQLHSPSSIVMMSAFG